MALGTPLTGSPIVDMLGSEGGIEGGLKAGEVFEQAMTRRG
jgi:hypothetical protein